MSRRSSEQVAKLVGISNASLSRYIKTGKVPAPPETMAGGMRMRLWSESDIQLLKEILPKIANGRKTRYQKLRAAQKKDAQKQRAQAKKPVPGKRKTKTRKSKT